MRSWFLLLSVFCDDIYELIGNESEIFGNVMFILGS